MIKAITMPKWGLSMTEGLVGDWLVAEGAAVQSGTEVVLVETEKIAGGVEVADAGTLRRAVAVSGDTLPVGALLGVLAGAETPDAEVDAFITQFQENFVPAETAAEESGDQTEQIQVGELSINYLRQGDAAKTAVLLHGFGGDLNNWLFNQPALVANRTVIALDLPGHGLTTKKVANGSMLCQVHILQNMMEKLGVAEADWVGHSMGGAIALQLAQSRPDLVRSDPARPRSRTEYLLNSSRTRQLPTPANARTCSTSGSGEESTTEYLQGFTTSRNRRTRNSSRTFGSSGTPRT